MNPMPEELARATINARLAWAEERRQARRIEQDSREERRRRRRLAVSRWWRDRSRTSAVDASTLVAITHVDSPSARLARVLGEAAQRVVERGTASDRLLLSAMAAVAASSAPGAAAALVDPDGSETSRLRAFGFVHTHLLEVLGPREHALVLDLRNGEAGLSHPGRVA